MLATDNRYKILQTTPTCMTAIDLHECMTAINLHECRLYLNSHLTPQVIFSSNKGNVIPEFWNEAIRY